MTAAPSSIEYDQTTGMDPRLHARDHGRVRRTAPRHGGRSRSAHGRQSRLPAHGVLRILPRPRLRLSRDGSVSLKWQEQTGQRAVIERSWTIAPATVQALLAQAQKGGIAVAGLDHLEEGTCNLEE